MGYESSALIENAGDLFEKATTGPFLTGVRSGALPAEALNRWLVQDRIFVGELFRYQSIVLSKAPDGARPVLLRGLLALQMELEWFAEIGADRDLSDTEPHPVCDRYNDFLLRAAYLEPFPRLIQILFGVEAAYLGSFQRLKDGGRPPGGIYAELIERWSSDAFVTYVDELHELTVEHPYPDQIAFDEVLGFEHEFWRMTWEG